MAVIMAVISFLVSLESLTSYLIKLLFNQIVG